MRLGASLRLAAPPPQPYGLPPPPEGEDYGDSKAPAITRAAAILRLLGKSETPLGVNAIARELGLVPSTCLYVLRALVEEELVAFDPDTKRYSLDAGVLTLARGWLRRNRFADLVQPVLDRLARDHGVTMLGVQITGLEHIIVVAAAQGGSQSSSPPRSAAASRRCSAPPAAASRRSANYPAAQLEAKLQDPALGQSAGVRGMAASRSPRPARRATASTKATISPGSPSSPRRCGKGAGRPSHALVAIGIGNALGEDAVRSLGQALAASGRTLSEQMGG